MKGHIRQRAMGSWSLVVDLGRDADGKRKQKWITFKGSKRQAQRKLADIISSIGKKEFVEPSRMTVREYLEQWLDAVAADVSAKTHERYSEFVKVTIVPRIGQNRLSDLRPIHIQNLYSELLTDGRKDGKGGLSPRTVLHVHQLLSAASKQAVKWEMLLRNPCDAVDPPRPQEREMTVLDEAQAAHLMSRIASTKLCVPVVMALATGLRRGEFLALRWRDVDLDSSVLHVNRTLEQTKQLGLRFKTPKTKKSRRSVALPSFLVEQLREHRKRQAEHRLKLGPIYNNDDLVFPRDDGTPQSPRTFSAAFSEFIESTDLPRITLHGMRHTHATHLLKQGVHPKIVSERLGHSRIGLTLDTYSHVLPGMQEQAAEQFDIAMRAAMEKGKE